MCAGNCGSGGCNCTSVAVPEGLQGDPGASAYQIWLDEGNSGTEQDFLDSLIGPQGDAATIAVGTVTEVPNGDPPTVVNVGTVNDAIFDFEIPAGPQGDIGASRWTTTTNSFVQPAVGGTVNVNVVSTAPMPTGGEWWYINGGGYYVLQTVNTATNATFINTGLLVNAAPGATVNSGGLAGPSGVTGLGFGPPEAGVPSGAPPSGVIYQIDTDTGIVYYWNGFAWSVLYDTTGDTGPTGPIPNVFFTSAFSATAPANGAGIQIVEAGAGAGDLYLWNEGAVAWDGPYNINGAAGTVVGYGPELPSTLAPNVQAINDLRFYAPGGVVESLWVKIDNTPTWNLVGLISSTSSSSDQTFTALKTSAQALPGTNSNTTVIFSNDSTGEGRDPANVWNGSICTFIADAPTLRVTVEALSLRRDVGTQVITFTAYIYHRPLSTGIDVSVGSATFVYTGAAEQTLTAAVISSTDVTPLLGDQIRIVIDPSVAPTDAFSVLTAAKVYTQSV